MEDLLVEYIMVTTEDQDLDLLIQLTIIELDLVLNIQLIIIELDLDQLMQQDMLDNFLVNMQDNLLECLALNIQGT